MIAQLKNAWLILVVSGLVVVSPTSHVHGAIIISQGWDLLYTVNASYNFGGAGGLNLVNFVGKPIPNPPGTNPGTFDFGSGSVNIGQTDTILHRLQAVNLPDLPTLASQTINLQIAALSLQSANPVNWSGFGGVANEFIQTVNLVDLGSTMTVYNNPFDPVPNPDVIGKFDSNLKFSIQLRGMTSGVFSPVISLNMSQSGSLWTHDPVGNQVLIPGVNWKLNGVDTSTDFFTGFAHHGPDHIHDTIDINAVPEPSSLLLTGLLGLLTVVKSRRYHPRSNAK
ncbi:MAG: PEP-CTERM sorting domain-containing protein [Pirellulaceae bacterium]|nr:PEP-CTERM sorting domain-containing protein [Pirellulaceae bacterium]